MKKYNNLRKVVIIGLLFFFILPALSLAQMISEQTQTGGNQITAGTLSVPVTTQNSYLSERTAEEMSRSIPGDVNSDGRLDNFDITPFVYALTHTEAEFEAQYPTGNYWAADCNQDGLINNFDISPFVQLLTGG